MMTKAFLCLFEGNRSSTFASHLSPRSTFLHLGGTLGLLRAVVLVRPVDCYDRVLSSVIRNLRHWTPFRSSSLSGYDLISVTIRSSSRQRFDPHHDDDSIFITTSDLHHDFGSPSRRRSPAPRRRVFGTQPSRPNPGRIPAESRRIPANPVRIPSATWTNGRERIIAEENNSRPWKPTLVGGKHLTAYK